MFLIYSWVSLDLGMNIASLQLYSGTQKHYTTVSGLQNLFKLKQPSWVNR